MKKTTPTHSIIILLKTRENLKSVRRRETGSFREEREPSGKDGVLPELVLQLRKTTETPKGEHPGFGVGA